MPVAMVRASLNQKLTRDYRPDWRFYNRGRTKSESTRDDTKKPLIVIWCLRLADEKRRRAAAVQDLSERIL